MGFGQTENIWEMVWNTGKTLKHSNTHTKCDVMDTQRETELKDQATVSGQPLQQLFHSGAEWTLMADSSTCAMDVTCEIEGTHASERCA